MKKILSKYLNKLEMRLNAKYYHVTIYYDSDILQLMNFNKVITKKVIRPHDNPA